MSPLDHLHYNQKGVTMKEDKEINSAWFKKCATLSDKSARNEFGLTQEEIIEGIEDGKLHYRINSVFGNSYNKLIRSEVETFVAEKYGSNYLKEYKIKKKLAQTNKKLKQLKTQVASLEQRKAELLANLDDLENNDKESCKWKRTIIVTVNPDVKITGVPVSKTMNHVMTNVDALTARIHLME